jgi:hypothetical protein
MTNVPDYRGRIESDKPQDFFHRVANMIPGYTGYQDKERRREADKELRMFLARRFREQHAALARTQQQLARSRHLEAIGEVDRLGGVLQRFIDKLETATQGYAGLFDPVKVQEPELDQLYTFDAALTSQLQQVTSDIAAIGAAAQQGSGPAPAATAGAAPDLPAALNKLSATLDALLQTWNHRNEVIMSGRPMPEAEFNKFRASAGVAGAAGGASGPAPQAGAYPGPAGAQAPGGQPYGGAPGGSTYSGAQGSQPGGSPYGGTQGSQPGGAQYPGQAPQAGPQPYQPPAGGGQAGTAQPYQPYDGGQAGAGQPNQPYSGGGQPYQPYAGGAGADAATGKLPPPGSAASGGPPQEAATRRLDPSAAPASEGDSASDVTGPPTGGPTGEQH